MLWVFPPQSKSPVPHLHFCNFALVLTTPNLRRSLDVDITALVMSHGNIFTYPSILVRGLVKQRKDRELLVEIPK